MHCLSQTIIGELALFYFSRALIVFVVAQYSKRTRAAARWGVLSLGAMLLFELCTKLLLWVNISGVFESIVPFMTAYETFELLHVMFTPFFAGLMFFSAWIYYDMRRYTFGVLASLASTNAACNEYLDDIETTLRNIKEAQLAIDKRNSGSGGAEGDTRARATKRAQVEAQVAAAQAKLEAKQRAGEEVPSGGEISSCLSETERRERLAQVFQVDHEAIVSKAGFENSRSSLVMAINDEVTTHTEEMKILFANTLGANNFTTAAERVASTSGVSATQTGQPQGGAAPVTAMDAVGRSAAAMGGGVETTDAGVGVAGQRGPIAAARTAGAVRRRNKRSRG
jgi:hypothetical protein